MDSSRELLRQLKNQPTNTELLKKLARVYETESRLKSALRCYEKALQVKPSDVDALIAKAEILERLKQVDQAIYTLELALKIEPSSSRLHSQLAQLYKKTHQYERALESLSRAIKLEPTEAQWYIDLGNLLYEQNLIDEAIACYKSALFYRPQSCEAHNNLAIAYKDNHDLSLAFEHFSKALSLCPDSPEIHFNYSLALLLEGNYLEGFKEYEWRWLKKDNAPYAKDFGVPLWDGSFSSSTLLVTVEQGIGDTIFFFRYLPLVKERGLKVILQCHRELVTLLSDNYGVDKVLSLDQKPEGFDLYCPLLSLPYVMKTELSNIPKKVPYIIANCRHQEEVLSLIGQSSDLKVGLVWAGSPEHSNDKNRSMRLSEMAPLFRLKGARFYSLQKGQPAEEAKRHRELIELSGYIKDFSDTAAIVANLDLVITVDTAVAHLAAAMAKEVWILLPYSPDWRWMLHRSDSLWYPTAKLFRQKRRNDWSEVIREVIEHWTSLGL